MSWTGKRILILAAMIFAAHVFAIFALHTPTPMVILPDGFRSPRIPAARQGMTNGVVEMDGINDPLVFAGAHEHGFSAAAWMMRPQQDYALTRSMPPPRFLAFERKPTEFPAGESERFARPSSVLPFLEIGLPKVAGKSTVLVEGGLDGRGLVRAPEIPIQFGSDVLSNTVVQVGVRGDGFPFSARIISGSSSRVADLKALEIANNSRFAPLPTVGARGLIDAGELQWGEMVFQWFTTEPVVTNGVTRVNGANPTGAK